MIWCVVRGDCHETLEALWANAGNDSTFLDSSAAEEDPGTLIVPETDVRKTGFIRKNRNLFVLIQGFGEEIYIFGRRDSSGQSLVSYTLSLLNQYTTQPTLDNWRLIAPLPKDITDPFETTFGRLRNEIIGVFRGRAVQRGPREHFELLPSTSLFFGQEVTLAMPPSPGLVSAMVAASRESIEKEFTRVSLSRQRVRTG